MLSHLFGCLIDVYRSFFWPLDAIFFMAASAPWPWINFRAKIIERHKMR